MKKILSGILLVCLLCFLLGCTADEPKEPAETEEKSIEVDPADQACEADEDCVMAMVKCSCDCGVPINKANWQKYLDEKEEMCEDYQGRMCKMLCEQNLGCVDNVCSVVEG